MNDINLMSTFKLRWILFQNFLYLVVMLVATIILFPLLFIMCITVGTESICEVSNKIKYKSVQIQRIKDELKNRSRT